MSLSEALGGAAILYALVCLIPCVIARLLGVPGRGWLYLWMLATGWNPLGWIAAALYIWLARGDLRRA